MAEIAGLVIGVVGVAGVIGAFKDTIDLFNDFMSSREFGRDYEILDTKVDIERAILLQWAENVKLLKSDYDRRLDDDVVRRAVAGILGCIKFLMGDEAQLRTRYGLKEDVEQRRGNETNSAAVISGPRMAKFIREFEAMKLRSKMLDKTTTFSKKVRWVIRDKEKFEELVRELAHFTTKLMQIVPVFASQEAAQHASDRDVTAIGTLRELKLILDASVGRRRLIADSTREHIIHICQEQILRLLWFRTIDLRKESVSPAHCRTFNWVLEPSEQTLPWDDITKWLSYDSGIYWVSGKAGSGKSTLMKYLFQHKKTATLLSKWAGGMPYHMYHFFFWNMGTYEQKSQEGLSRALLHQILSDHPSLIKEALPNMWEQLYNSDGEVCLPLAPEIRYAFQVLANKTSQIGKFCLFIDGLDEFIGNYRDGIAFIKELSEHSHIKILVSSRPIPDCVASFERLPSLQLHHLTHGDIKAYVEDVIGKHRYMEGLMARHPDESSKIMEYLVTKSSGVFLWVILACRSLLSGFADYDKIHELRQRVDELPPELEDMFQHMMNKINKRHREQGSRMLKICYTNTQARDKNEVGNLSSLGLALMDDDYKSIEQISTLSAEQKHRLCEELEGRLRSRTGGLLETYWSLKSSCTQYCFCGAKGKEDHDGKIDGRVEFMHRTVLEFLSNERAWDLECLQPPSGLQVGTELSLISLYSAIASLPGGDPQAIRFLRDGFQWGAQADLEDPNGGKNIFYVIRPFINHLSSNYSLENDMIPRIVLAAARPLDANRISLLLAAEAGAVNFVRGHLFSQHDSSLTPNPEQLSQLLYHSVSPLLIKGNISAWRWKNVGLGNVSKEMVSLLLAHGADPNLQVSDRKYPATSWSYWLSSVEGKSLEGEERLHVAEVTEIFVQHGARLSNDFCRWVRLLLPRKPFPSGQNAISRLHELVSKFEHEQELKTPIDSPHVVQATDEEKICEQESRYEGGTSELTTGLRSRPQCNVRDLKRKQGSEISLDEGCKRTRIGHF
ncbi:prion-inhibition and propagation-domain-containing protein [Annulohypoxylon truncatum]|uniref:prion-inhibition and propagation-domain-containing protein n=1 Tax=Annulohypoxylon truncatum TaxID=327061 RepID=UPI00200780F7|nr:prion-inhibition and propagation-domain-containing protein [Annulohypoxylon truncatum]KAI1214247.1 prion-inhibition and propagation-domain-containing protein [Annulohypoxylon truncatum]